MPSFFSDAKFFSDNVTKTIRLHSADNYRWKFAYINILGVNYPPPFLLPARGLITVIATCVWRKSRIDLGLTTYSSLTNSPCCAVENAHMTTQVG